ncbi:DUF523 domain-containing protein [Catenisphaera adipataccumulans]|uniref:Uncharacterized protein YbbK (DUF523 family) n=1 Tax=Catenisphaera adipataccumulans TaxID=700500 RepID=A0A7W8CXW0_9FIRM|nr:DUF523 domain-containing protein [Catenisphaera adipataccumulans]MBB5183628.1 uncharacterized protein YbbK (DUF523 family) [Catenisphaera adipataccumulans]
MKIGVSACLLGENCKYDGGNNRSDPLIELLKGHDIIPFCPERMGGLSCPRVPCEIIGRRVIGKDGQDYTRAYQDGAEAAYKLLKDSDVRCVVLKRNSPSCGYTAVYDGTFTHTLRRGSGVFASKLSNRKYFILEV